MKKIQRLIIDLDDILDSDWRLIKRGLDQFKPAMQKRVTKKMRVSYLGENDIRKRSESRAKALLRECDRLLDKPN
jgi:hypothetical protein